MTDDASKPVYREENRATAIRNFITLRRVCNKMDGTIMQIMKHPDATPEMLWELHQTAVARAQRMAETWKLMLSTLKLSNREIWQIESASSRAEEEK